MEAGGFLELAGRGRNGIWRYVLGWTTAIGCWIGLSFGLGLAVMVYLEFDGDPATYLNGVAGPLIVGLGPLADYVLINLTFLPLLFGLFVAVRLIHRRPFRTLVTGRPRVRWGLVLRSGLAFFVPMAALSAVQAAATPEAFVLQFEAAAFALLLPVALVLTSMQSMTEELAFRGYLMQGLRRLTARRWIIVAVSSAAFVAPHYGNPDLMAAPVLGFINLAAFGALAACASIKADGLEPALGFHAANNLFIVLVVNPTVAEMPTPSIAIYTLPPGAVDLAIFLVAGTLFYLATPRAEPAGRPVIPPGSS